MRGADERAPFARTLAAALGLAVLCALPIILILLHIDRLLILFGTDPHLSVMALDYERGFVWGVPAALWQIACRFYLSSLERPRVIMLTIAGACMTNIVLNWLLIYGHFGLPALGLRGSAFATSLTCWGMAITLTAYSARYRLFPPGLWSVRWAELRQGLGELLSVGWPIAGTTIVEMGLFSASTVLMARFGPAPLAAHQICLGIATITFMVPLAIGQASTVRVAFHSGGQRPKEARRAGFIALGLGIAFMAVTALTLKILAAPIIHLYIDGKDPLLPEILEIGGQMIVLAAIFQIFDGAQAVASGALRGLKDTRTALLAAMLGYWGIGMPLGALLAFKLDWGPAGLWWGFVVGLIVVSALLSARFNLLSKRLAVGTGV